MHDPIPIMYVSAGEDTIKLARDCIHNKRDFSVETTLAGGNVIRLMHDARANGFEVSMFYLGLGVDNGSITYRSDLLPQWSESIVHSLQSL